jgi:hypothetical protein
MMAPSFTMLSILIATRGGLGGCTIPPSDCIHVAATTLICNTKQQEAVSWNGGRQDLTGWLHADSSIHMHLPTVREVIQNMHVSSCIF